MFRMFYIVLRDCSLVLEGSLSSTSVESSENITKEEASLGKHGLL